jgi:hypothetical protein
MVCRLPAATSGLENDIEMLFEFSLTDKFIQSSRPQPTIFDRVHLFVCTNFWIHKFFTHDALPTG